MTDTSPRWVDAHCHLDLYSDHVALLKQCEQAQIATLAVTTTPAAWKRNRELARGQFVKIGLGLHPQLVAERGAEIELWKSLLPEADFVGEIGLDAGPRFYRSFEHQKRIFQTILDSCAEVGGKVLSVHSVRCTPTILSMLESHFPTGRGIAILHWFSGTKSEARRAHDIGCYFSVNAEMLRTEKGKDLVRSLDPDRILTETDGPFGTVDGRPARPGDVRSTVGLISELHGIQADRTGDKIIDNWLRLANYIASEKTRRRKG